MVDFRQGDKKKWVGSRERSVFISVPQGLKVGGEFTHNPGSQEDITFVAGLSNPMKDNDTLDWVNDNEVTVFLKSWHFACPKVSITGW